MKNKNANPISQIIIDKLTIIFKKKDFSVTYHKIVLKSRSKNPFDYFSPLLLLLLPYQFVEG